jgi:hypothetical protein
MAAERGTLETIAQGLASLFLPLEDRIRAGDIRLLLAELGLEFPASVDGDAGLVAAMQSEVLRIRDLPPIIGALTDAVTNENLPQIIAKGLQLANAVLTLIGETEKLGTAIRALAGTGIPPAELNQFAAELPGRIVDYLVVRNLEEIPGAAEVGDFVGFVERVDVPGVDAQHPAFTRRKLHLDQLTGFITNPLGQLGAKYQWGMPGFTGLPLLQKLATLLAQAGVPAVLDTTGPLPALDFVFVEVTPKLDAPQGLVIKVIHPLAIDNAAPFVEDDWQIRIILNTPIGPGLQIVVQPNDGITLIPATLGNRVEGDLMVEWTGGKTDGTPYLIVGEPGSSRLEARQLVARAGAGLAWNSNTNQAVGTFKVEADINNGKLVVSLGSADGFIGKILGGFGLEANFGVGIGFSTKQGFYFHGSATLDIQLPLHVQLGPVELTALTLTIGIQGSTFPIGLRTDIKASLGPLKGVVEQIGAGVQISVPDNRKGNAGPVDFKLIFLPPTGVGLSIDLAVLSGGGFLRVDSDRGEYAGALELTLAGFISLKAIGIITTKMPDGSKGFSLLLILTADFGPGIQLGFGFTLLAVGGLVGLNRTMNLPALMNGVRTNAIESIMFPKDVIANAPKIISDLRTIFPPQEGTFLIGPMAKIGWGTPTLISISLGVIIEIPGNIAILGVLKVAIPAAEIALILLQVNFAGAIEFDKKRIYFFAAMFESRIVFLTIEGEMGLLIAFGDDANFVLSVGGFHPAFSPPPLPFPSPRRISVSLLSTPVSRLTIQGYFAVTSNTVQFGARADLVYGLDSLNVHGSLAFDALFQFSPFRFIIQISASLSVNVFGAGLFSVGVSGLLEGPAPYHIKGHGSISLLFWDIGVDFETTWGDSRDTSLPPIKVLPLLENELKKTDNWRALLPPTSNLLVSLRKMPQAEAGLILHPVGVLHLSQRALPLGIKLDKVGNQKPSDVNRLSIAVTAGGLAKKNDAFELFAPAQFQDFSDSDKLSKPAFGPEPSGLDMSVAGVDLRSSEMVKRVVRYEEIIIDNNYKRFSRRYFRFTASLFNHFLAGAAVTKSSLSQANRNKVQPFAEKIDVAKETFTVAFQSNNQAYAADSISFHSEASAREYLSQKVSAQPSLADEIHVIPGFERVA